MYFSTHIIIIFLVIFSPIEKLIDTVKGRHTKDDSETKFSVETS